MRANAKETGEWRHRYLYFFNTAQSTLINYRYVIGDGYQKISTSEFDALPL